MVKIFKGIMVEVFFPFFLVLGLWIEIIGIAVLICHFFYTDFGRTCLVVGTIQVIILSILRIYQITRDQDKE